MQAVETLEEGDIVYALIDFYNDGSIEHLDEGALLASKGARGVIVRIGHVEHLPDKTVFLVRFEDKDNNLGDPIGCWADELGVALAS
jgi:nitrogen fixation protein NifZ